MGMTLGGHGEVISIKQILSAWGACAKFIWHNMDCAEVLADR